MFKCRYGCKCVLRLNHSLLSNHTEHSFLISVEVGLSKSHEWKELVGYFGPASLLRLKDKDWLSPFF